VNLHRNLASAVNGVRWVDAYSSDVAHSDAVVVDILQDNVAVGPFMINTL